MTRTKKGNLIGRAATTHKREIRESLAGKRNKREIMLDEIKRMFKNDEAFHNWYDSVYRLRANNNMPAYEARIRSKYYYMRAKENRAKPPYTDHLPPAEASEIISEWSL